MSDDRSRLKASIAMPPRLSMPIRELRRIDTRELLGANGELIIVHSGREYHLRVTSNGKLILTA